MDTFLVWARGLPPFYGKQCESSVKIIDHVIYNNINFQQTAINVSLCHFLMLELYFVLLLDGFFVWQSAGNAWFPEDISPNLGRWDFKFYWLQHTWDSITVSSKSLVLITNSRLMCMTYCYVPILVKKRLDYSWGLGTSANWQNVIWFDRK